MTESLFFLAIIPPPTIRAEVEDIKEMVAREYKSRQALKSPPHITLFPPFWFEETKLSMLSSFLTQFASTRDKMDISLKDYNCFKPRVIFIDVERSTVLNDFQSEIKIAMKEQWNLNGDGRPAFHPHMTIAFKDLSKRNFYVAWDFFQNLTFEASFRAEELVLLRHQNGLWKIESTYPLKSES